MTKEQIAHRYCTNADELMSAIIDLVAMTPDRPDVVFIDAASVRVGIESDTLSDGSKVHNLLITVNA